MGTPYTLILGLVVWLLAASPLQAIEFKAVQCVLPTTDGASVDCTSSGFGAPSGAVVFGGYGATNGVVATHSAFSMGFYDGTRQASIGGAAEDGQAPTDTGSFADGDSVYGSVLSTSQARNGDCTASIITDGIRLTCADAPPVAFLVNVWLIGGDGVSNLYVGQATGNATQNGATSVTAPGFLANCLLVISNNNNLANFRPSLGFACKNSGVITQRGIGFNNNDNAANAATSAILSTTRVMQGAVAASASLEVTDIHATGFEVTTRDANGARDFAYLAIQLSGITAWVGTVTSPAGTGSQAITGVGFLPQAGMMLYGEFPAVDTLYSTDDGEVMGVSIFDASASATSSLYGEDGNGTSIEESVTDATLCRSRKDGANYATCSLTSMDSNGLTRNYSVNAGGVRQQAMLLFQSASVPTSTMMMKRRWQ